MKKRDAEKELESKKSNVRVDPDLCTGCELCAQTCPEIFEMEDDIAVAKVNNVPSEVEETCKQAEEECPVEAIIYVSESKKIDEEKDTIPSKREEVDRIIRKPKVDSKISTFRKFENIETYTALCHIGSSVVDKISGIELDENVARHIAREFETRIKEQAKTCSPKHASNWLDALSFGWSLNMKSANDEPGKQKLIDKFKAEPNKNKRTVLIVDVNTDAPKVWTIAMFNDEGEFINKELIDGVYNELAIELNKEEPGTDRIIELATSYLGFALSFSPFNEHVNWKSIFDEYKDRIKDAIRSSAQSQSNEHLALDWLKFAGRWADNSEYYSDCISLCVEGIGGEEMSPMVAKKVCTLLRDLNNGETEIYDALTLLRLPNSDNIWDKKYFRQAALSCLVDGYSTENIQNCMTEIKNKIIHDHKLFETWGNVYTELNELGVELY